MARIRPLRAAVLGLVIGLVIGPVLAGCGADAAADDPGFAGHWTSNQWGEHYVRVEGSTVKIIYDHDNGRILGDLDGGKLVGWWTETPSRKPSRDAGEVTFTLTTDGGARAINGEWRYGTDGAMRENWDLTWVGAEIPAEIAAKFDESALFVRHP
jgi:hypothetical protein